MRLCRLKSELSSFPESLGPNRDWIEFSCLDDHLKFRLVFPAAEFWTRVRHFLKPSPNVVHYILTHFHWLWDIINNTFLRDVLMRLVLTGLSSSFKSTVTYLLSLIGYFPFNMFFFFAWQWGPTWFPAHRPTTQNMATSTGNPTIIWATTRGCCPQCQRTVPLLWGSKVRQLYIKLRTDIRFQSPNLCLNSPEIREDHPLHLLLAAGS